MIRNRKLKGISQHLRRNQTDEENKLWYGFLCDLPVQFHRQYIIESFVVDFCCPTKMVVIEIDGFQHYALKSLENKDKMRDAKLAALGYTVLRYSNHEINKEFDSVCDTIYYHLNLD
ncbi:MAG: endonuclease domain-containing protein [Candidatus Coproplasma sp.]